MFLDLYKILCTIRQFYGETLFGSLRDNCLAIKKYRLESELCSCIQLTVDYVEPDKQTNNCYRRLHYPSRFFSFNKIIISLLIKAILCNIFIQKIKSIYHHFGLCQLLPILLISLPKENG